MTTIQSYTEYACRLCGHVWRTSILAPLVFRCPACRDRSDIALTAYPVHEATCLECGFVWRPEQTEKPLVCPSCSGGQSSYTQKEAP